MPGKAVSPGWSVATMQSVNVPERLQRALSRLASAIDHLEAAAARRAQLDAARGNLEDELWVMQDDRARLALDLDGALASGRALAGTQGEVAQRLERASATVRAVLAEIEEARSGPPGPG